MIVRNNLKINLTFVPVLELIGQKFLAELETSYLQWRIFNIAVNGCVVDMVPT
jgi:hypothetical protein